MNEEKTTLKVNLNFVSSLIIGIDILVDNLINKLNANIIGFVFFGLLYGFMYNKYLLKMKNGNNKTNQLLFLCFLILWAFYGIFYLMKESIKNTGYNILDLLSKCFVGIYFWTYSSKIFN